MADTTRDRIVLLFCHGASSNKDCWNPIIRRLQSSPLLKRVTCEVAAFNWRLHGDKKDRSLAAKVYYHNGDKYCPRVEHPLTKFFKWGPPMLREEINKLRADDARLSRRTRIVGIGHSMGATMLLLTEIASPGTFEGIIGFEPPFDDGSFGTEKEEIIRDALMRAYLAQQDEWDTWEAMMHHFKTSSEFRRWDREVVTEFLKQGVEKVDGGNGRLVMSSMMGGGLFSAVFERFQAEDLAKAKCKIVYEHTENKLAKQLNGQLIRELSQTFELTFTFR